MESLERDCEEYQTRKNKPVDEDAQQISLEQLLPEPLKTHISLNSERFDTYAKVRAEVFTYAERIKQEGLTTDAPGAVPMEVDALLRKGDRKGDGKGVSDSIGLRR